MDLGSLHALASSLTFSAHGVPVTVTPLGSVTPIATRGVWLPQVGRRVYAETFIDRPFGTDLQRREPRRVLALERTDSLTAIARGSVISAPERSDLAAKTWKVDGHDLADVDQFRVIVVPEP